MRFVSTVVSAAALSGCLYFGLHRDVGAQNPADPVSDIFDQRALTPHTKPEGGLAAAVATALTNSPIGKAYNAIRPERSVLIFDCEPTSLWCGQPAFRFQAILTEAARVANPAHPAPDALALSWYGSAIGMDKDLPGALPKFTSLEQAPLQLLAIANRMDLAQWDGKVWSGAEIHFVYGVTPAPDAAALNLTVILEFQLPPYDRSSFKSLAQTWSDLSTVADGQYAAKLLNALASSGLSLGQKNASRVSSVRLRMNHEIRPGVWRLTQFVLKPGGNAFSPAKLTDQIGAQVKPDSRLYLSLWKKAQSVVASGRLQYAVPDELLEAASMTYNVPDQGMATPPGVCNASEAVRDVLALQQCSLCHTVESNTVFAHLPNRDRNQSTVPSGFLIGKGKNLHPSLVDLYYGEDSVVWPVKVPYTTYTGPAGGPCATPTVSPVCAKRKFHDVARRSLFLAAVQTDSPLTNGLPQAIKFSTFSTE
jgi:hypothetical protein